MNIKNVLEPMIEVEQPLNASLKTMLIMPRTRKLLILFCLLISFPIHTYSQKGTKEDPYIMKVFWKKKGGKMALFSEAKKTPKTQITDYIFDTDCKESFGKGNLVNPNFIEKSGVPRYSYEQQKHYVGIHGNVVVKINGLYNLLNFDTWRENNKWKLVFSEGFDSWEVGAIANRTTSDGESNYLHNYVYVTRPDSPLKGLLDVDHFLGSRQGDKYVLDCEYDDIILADIGYTHNNEELLIYSYDKVPSFITRKGKYWGAVERAYSVWSAKYDLKSFTHTEQIPVDKRQDLKTPYLIRKHAGLLLAERNDSTFVANSEGREMNVLCSPDTLPKYNEQIIPQFHGDYSPNRMKVFDAPDNMAAHIYPYFIPHKGSTYDIKPFHPFPSDSILTFILSGDYGAKLYNVKIDKELISNATSISPIPDSNGFLSVSLRGDALPRAAFVTRDNSEAVILNSMENMSSLSNNKTQFGSTQIINYRGSVGLYDSISGFALPCSFDSIVPLAQKVDSIPDVIGGLFLAYKKKEFGLVGPSASIMGVVFNGIKRTADGKGVELTAKVYNSPDNYSMKISTPDGQNLSFDDNIDTLFQNLFKMAKKEDIKYTHSIDYLLHGLFEFAAKINRSELIPRIYESGAIIAANAAVSLSNERNAIEMLDKAEVLYEMAVCNSETQLIDLDIPGIRKSVIENFRQQEIARAEAEAARQRELERQAQIREVQLQQRAQAWTQLANALAQVGQSLNNAVITYNASKTSKRQVQHRYTPTVSRQQNTTTNHAPATTYTSTSSKTKRTANYNNRTMLEIAYETAKGIVMKYYYGQYTWNLNEVRKQQASMRDIRANAKKQGFTIYKSDFEDVSKPYRK